MKHKTTKHTGLSRGVAILSLTALGLFTTQAQIPLPIYEPFPASYTNTSDETIQVPPGSGLNYLARRLGAGDTATLWSIGGTPGGGSAVVVGGAAALSYSGLYQDPNPNVGLFIRTNNTTGTRSRAILHNTITSGTLYASFLLNVQNLPSASDPNGANRLFAKMDNATTGTGGSSMAGVWLTPAGSLALSKSSNTATNADTGATLSAGTHLVVMRYTWSPDVGDDEVALWIDPSSGSFNVAEGSVPTPTLTATNGTDVASLSSFYNYHIGSETVAGMFLDEIRLATTWADVTSTQALCVASSVSAQPTNTTVNEGISGIFRVIAGGSSPTYQWQISTNSGGTWDNVADGIGGTSSAYWTRPLTPADSNKQYRTIVSVACGGGSTATSSVATVTVVPASITPSGLVVDDTFTDGLYNNTPNATNNSVWFAGVASSLDASSTTHMTGTVPVGSVNWLGYFTDNSVTNLPVHLDVGREIKATLVFRGNNIVSSNGSVRVGLFNYADGGTRPTADGFGNVNATGTVRGYMVALNYGAIYSANPFSLYVRNNIFATDLMGTTGSFAGLGGGPGGYAGQPAFQNGVDYTLVLTLKRSSVSSVDFTTTVTGGGTNWTYTATDSSYAFPRFDCLAIRAGSAATAADSFEFSRFKVEVITPAPVVNLNPTNIVAAFTSTDVTLSWPASHLGWNLQVQTNSHAVGITLPTNTWFTVPDSAATNSVTIPISKQNPTVFYRLQIAQ